MFWPAFYVLFSLFLLQGCHGTTCTVGNIQVYGSTIDSLAPCNIIIGNLTLAKNLSSSELNLPNLTSITGSLYMYNIKLTDLDGLSNLADIEGSLSIGSSTNLTSLAGLGQLQRVGGSLGISSNQALPTTSELKIQKIGGSVTVLNNYALQDVQFLAGFTAITGDLNIQANPRLVDLTGLNQLQNVGGLVFVVGNAAHDGIDFLDNLLTVGGAFYVDGYSVSNGSHSWLPRLDVVGGTFKVGGVTANDTNLDLAPVLRKVGAYIQLIRFTGVQRLTGFNLLTAADSIQIQVTYGLLEIDSFSVVDTLGSLLITENYNLTTVKGLGQTNFTSVNGTVQIFLNPFLQDLNFLSSLETINNGGLLIENCSSLPDLKPLAALRYIAGSFIFYGNPLIQNVDPLINLQYVGLDWGDSGPISVHVKYNDGLSQVDGFSSLTTVLGDIQLFGNKNLYSVAGFCNLTAIDSPVYVGGPLVCCDAAASVFPAQADGLLDLVECAPNCNSTNNFTCTCFPPNPTDPNSPRASRCINGGICHPLPNGFYCTCPAGYIGTICEIPLPVIQSLTPSTTSLLGGVNMSLFGVYPPNVTDAYLEGKLLDIRDYKLTVNYGFQFWFITPPNNNTGYKNLTVRSHYYGLQNVTRMDLLYYVPVSMKDCIMPGMFWFQNKCQSCPKGGLCPGADRVWPVRGYWAFDEKTIPVQCVLYEACPGALGEDPSYPIRSLLTGARNTSQCSYSLGYQGDFCDGCRYGFYKDGAKCRTCSGTSSDYSEFIGLMVAALIFFFVCAVAVVAFTDRQLASGVTALVHCQQFIVVGVLVSPFLFSDSSSSAFRILSLLNFDIQYFKPGCTVPRFNYITGFWITMAVFVVAAIMFVIAAGVRSWLLPDTSVSRFGVSRRKIWKRRTVHALIILGNIIYLQFCLRALESLSCTKINGVRRLRVSLSTECNTAEHAGMSVAIYLLLFGFGFGFPGYCFYVLRRVARIRENVAAGLSDPKRMMKYFYLYRQCKPQYYWFRWLNFVTSFILAVESTVASSIGAQMLIAFILFTTNIMLVLWIWPLERWYFNISMMAAGIGTVSQAMYYLYNLQPLLFYITFPIIGFLLILVTVFRLCGVTFERARDFVLCRKHVPRNILVDDKSFATEKSYEEARPSGSGLINAQLLGENKDTRASLFVTGDTRDMSGITYGEDLEPNQTPRGVISSLGGSSFSTIPRGSIEKKSSKTQQELEDELLRSREEKSPSDAPQVPPLTRSVSAPETSTEEEQQPATDPRKSHSREKSFKLPSSLTFSVAGGRRSTTSNPKLQPVELTELRKKSKAGDDDKPPGLEADDDQQEEGVPVETSSLSGGVTGSGGYDLKGDGGETRTPRSSLPARRSLIGDLLPTSQSARSSITSIPSPSVRGSLIGDLPVSRSSITSIPSPSVGPGPGDHPVLDNPPSFDSLSHSSKDALSITPEPDCPSPTQVGHSDSPRFPPSSPRFPPSSGEKPSPETTPL